MAQSRQTSLPIPATSSPTFRRRRIAWFSILAFLAIILFISRSDPFSATVSSYLQNPLSPSPSNLEEVGPPDAPEILGLQHFVLNSEASLSDFILEAPEDEGWKLDPKQEIDLRVYASFNNDRDWEKHVKVLGERSPLVVFSKKFCPYSRKAKLLLKSYRLDPPPTIIEVDSREDADVIKVILSRLTGHSTFPNVILRGTSLGGADDIQALHEQGRLRGVFEERGVKVKGSLDV